MIKVEKKFAFPYVSDYIRITDGERFQAWLWPLYENGEVVTSQRLAELSNTFGNVEELEPLFAEAILA